MSLTIGTRLGPYEILSLLGSGGMGEVYKSRDTRLDRVVAIKVLREHLANDPDRRARFDREARAISKLNHPHICTLYDVGHDNGIDYLVVEHLDGLTLAERLLKGPLPIAQALTVAIDIADALDAAHRAGIVHRDLKPANVMLTKAGAKLLDFGIARMTIVAAAGDLTRAAPAGALTVDGTLLGTVQYMAPEQLEGREADARSDIFAFGALLYEMLTGRRAFPGESQASVIAAVLERDPPPLAAAQPLVPPSLDHFIKVSLAKVPDARWQSAADVRHQLEWLAANAATSQPYADVSSSRLRERTAWIAVLVVAITAGTWVWSSRGARVEAPETRLDLVTPPDADTTAFALSPDGRSLVFRALGGTERALWLRPLDAETAHLLPGTENAELPFWARDSRRLGFFANSKLKLLDLSTGSVQTVADAPAQGAGGAWNADDVIVFGGAGGVLQRISASGGAPAEVKPRDGISGRFPEFLPDGRHLLFYARTPADEGVYKVSLDSNKVEMVLRSQSRPIFVPPDRLLISREGALLSQRLNLQEISPLGEPQSISARVLTIPSYTFGAIAASASATGTIAYRATDAARRYVWLNRTGSEVGRIGEADIGQPRIASLSPDGATLAVTRTLSGDADLWLLDMMRGSMRRYTTAPGVQTQPVWSPDGRRLAYISSEKGKYDLYEQPSDGSAPPRLLLAMPTSINVFDWSSDGRYILMSIFAGLGRDIWALPMFGDRRPFPVVQSPFEENEARFSPDGRWIAFRSDESGRREIYVQPFPGPGAKIQVSTTGGDEPVAWRRDGRELFFLTSGNTLTSAALTLEGRTLRASAPVVLFTAPLGADPDFVADPDGSRFLFRLVTKDVSPITLLFNWKPGASHAAP